MISEKERVELDMIFASIRTSRKNMIKKYLKNVYKKIISVRKKDFAHQLNRA